MPFDTLMFSKIWCNILSTWVQPTDYIITGSRITYENHPSLVKHGNFIVPFKTIWKSWRSNKKVDYAKSNQILYWNSVLCISKWQWYVTRSYAHCSGINKTQKKNHPFKFPSRKLMVCLDKGGRRESRRE